MPRPTGPRKSRLNAEEQQLEKQREELLRQQQALETKLKRIPLVIEQQKEQQRKMRKDRAASAGRAISPDIRPLGRGGRRSTPKKLPSSQLFAAQLKTIALLAVFLLILFMLWRVIPS